jgi:histidinol-phosphate aminotransferase
LSFEYRPGQGVDDVRARAGGRPLHKLSSNENPLGPSPRALAAIEGALAGLSEYPARTDAAARTALAGALGRGLTDAHLCVGNSALDVMAMVEEACGLAGGSAIVCPPTFGAYASSARQRGGEVIEVPLRGEDFAFDAGAVAAACRPDTRLVYVGNPNNPTGGWFGQDTFDRLLDALPAHVLVVYDEVYHHFAEPGALPDAVGAVLAGRHLVVVHSTSKAYGLAGLRAGWAIGAPELIERLAARKRSFHHSSLTLAGLIGAVADVDHVARTLANNAEQRPWLAARLQALGVRVWPSQANFLLFECPGGGLAGEWEERLLGHGIMVRGAFYLPHHIRVSVGTPEANRALVDAMAAELAAGGPR